jgi:hypothetical protein
VRTAVRTDPCNEAEATVLPYAALVVIWPQRIDSQRPNRAESSQSSEALIEEEPTWEDIQW